MYRSCCAGDKAQILDVDAPFECAVVDLEFSCFPGEVFDLLRSKYMIFLL